MLVRTAYSLLDYLVGHMPNPDNTPDDERRAQFDGYLSQLKRRWGAKKESIENDVRNRKAHSASVGGSGC